MIGTYRKTGGLVSDYAMLCFHTAEMREVQLGKRKAANGKNYCKVYCNYDKDERSITPSEDLDRELIEEGLKLEGLRGLTLVLRARPPEPIDETYRPTVGIEVSSLTMDIKGNVINVGDVWEITLEEGIFIGKMGRYNVTINQGQRILEVNW